MRLLILGGLGAYPERLNTFVEAGHRLWYVCSHPHTNYMASICEHLAGITAFDLAKVDAEPVGWLQRLIEHERIEVVYSLLNAWDGSNQITAALLRKGSPVPWSVTIRNIC